jgi:arylsulfatase A-like enzyme
MPRGFNVTLSISRGGTGGRATVSTRRIFHTILDAARVPPPLDEADPNANVSALTLANATNGHADAENNVAFSEAFPPQTFLGFIQHRNPALIHRLRLSQVRRGVYDGTHKLALVGDQVEGLYDVANDPAEIVNLSAQENTRAHILQQQAAVFMAEAERRRANSGLSGEVDESVLDHLRALGYVE